MRACPTRPPPARTVPLAHAGRAHLAAAMLLLLVTLAIFWPGIAEYDTLRQYEQARSGIVDDWHPPIMARLWQALLPLGHGTAPLLALQLAGYWLGLALLADALAAIGRARAGWAMLAVGALPPLLGWQVVVLKDAQLVGAALAATGLVAAAHLRERRVPSIAIAAATILFAYALLVRANAVFAMAPLAAALLPLRRPVARAAATATIVAVVLAASGPINHGLFAATASGVEQTQPLYDLAGIAARTPNEAVPGLPTATLRAANCVTPYFWDPLGDTDACVAAVAALKARTAGALYVMLARAALRHPLAYAMQRAAHLNMTLRWLVPARLPGAAPPSGGEPNRYGFTNPGAISVALQTLADRAILTPLGWPFAWVALGLLLIAASRHQPETPTRRLAFGLLASALALEASFAAISIAADLRYHLWSITAIALAAVLLADAVRTRRFLVAAAVTAVLLMTPAIVARNVLPAPPQDYDALLGWQPSVALLPR